jgi:hypothetical protein
MMNCVPYNFDMEIREGGTYDKYHRWSIVGGSPVPINGFTALFTGRKKLTDDTILLSFSESSTPWVADGDSGIYILDDGADPDLVGKYQIYIKDNDTLGLCVNHKDIVGVYNMLLYNALGEAVVCQYGVLTIKASTVRI